MAITCGHFSSVCRGVGCTGTGKRDTGDMVDTDFAEGNSVMCARTSARMSARGMGGGRAESKRGNAPSSLALEGDEDDRGRQVCTRWRSHRKGSIFRRLRARGAVGEGLNGVCIEEGRRSARKGEGQREGGEQRSESSLKPGVGAWA